ncbi:hypothetical protein VF21_02596 [Pseudogymnoascus sp. 05NY08]|nr:hypothetical protein VF21_02596 [Pseudogymnoascus sp. 05NY08]
MLKVPCNQNQKFSMCYRVSTDASVFNYPPDLGCLPNGVTIANASISGANRYWRQSCSDKTWESEYCLNAFNGCPIDTNGNAPVTPCGGDAEQATTWCCGQSNTACCDTPAAIKIPLTIGPTSTTSTLSPSSSSSPAPSSTSSSGSSQTTPTPTPTLSPTETLIPQASGLSTGAKAGIGSAVGVGAAIFIGIALWLLMRRRKRKDRTEDHSVPELSERYAYVGGISELDSRRTPKQLDAPVFVHEMEGSRGSARKNSVGKAYNVDALYGGVPAELGDGKREI